MASALHLQIANIATLVAALTPQTNASDTFTRIGGDLPLSEEPPVLRRSFDVRFDPASVPLTQSWFGTSHRVVRGQFVVEVRYDGEQLERTLSQMIVEDTDQLTSLCESPSSRVSSDVLQVTLADRQIEVERPAVVMTLFFLCEYRVAL